MWSALETIAVYGTACIGISILIWTAAVIAYRRPIPEDEWTDDLRRIDQRCRDAGR